MRPAETEDDMDAQDLFEILVREHAGMLTVYLRSAVRDPAAVDDLFQETMIVAWRTLDRFDRRRPFGPWLRGIAGKLVLAHRRKSAAAMLVCDEQTLEHLDRRMTALQRAPGDCLDEKLEGLRQCVEALPDRYREAVKLRYRDELSASAVAQRLSLSLEAVKKQLQRGRSRLLECLERKLACLEGAS